MSPIIDTYGIEYVIGETNSISCQGRDEVSNVFGSALWYLDYNLYVAANTSVARMYFHQGTPYRYSLWAPYEGASNNSALIRPSYYGALMLSDALGGNGGSKQVHELLTEETFVAYSLYAKGVLDSVIIVNMEPYNSTANYSRPYTEVELPARIKQHGEIRRLTAPGADVKDGMTYAGQKVTAEGKITGRQKTESWRPGSKIIVPYSEAVLLTFGRQGREL